MGRHVGPIAIRWTRGPLGRDETRLNRRDVGNSPASVEVGGQRRGGGCGPSLERHRSRDCVEGYDFGAALLAASHLRFRKRLLCSSAHARSRTRTRRAGSHSNAPLKNDASEIHFSELLIEVNLLLSFVPSPFTAAMIAREIPAAIKPYSMAVAPVSSFKNREIIRMALTAVLSKRPFWIEHVRALAF